MATKQVINEYGNLKKEKDIMENKQERIELMNEEDFKAYAVGYGDGTYWLEVNGEDMGGIYESVEEAEEFLHLNY